jgi:DNA-binding transcriptional regulator YdaS (Cro superfamily)
VKEKKQERPGVHSMSVKQTHTGVDRKPAGGSPQIEKTPGGEISHERFEAPERSKQEVQTWKSADGRRCLRPIAQEHQCPGKQ